MPAPPLGPDYLRDFVKTELTRATAPRQRVLLAVSGGLDSMTLWHLAHAAGLDYAVAHVNYHLRGRDSDADEALVRATARERGVVLDVLANRTLVNATRDRQRRARDIRYDFFATVRAARGCAATLLAHHADDQLETQLIGLLQGRGPRALAGMNLAAADRWRPLLPYPKTDLRAYAKTHGVGYREDRSNEDGAYLRNRVRGELADTMKSLSPRLLAHSRRLGDEQRALLVFAEAQARRALESARAGESALAYRRSALAALPGLAFVLHTWLRDRGFDRVTVGQIAERIAAGPRAKARYHNRDRTRELTVAGKYVTLADAPGGE